MLLCQSFFFDTNQKHVCGKIYKVIKVFGCVAEVSFLQWLADLRFVKWVGFFERSCIVKLVIFFASFCWLWAFLLENLKLRQILQIFFGQNFVFLEFFWDVSASVILKFFAVAQLWWPTFSLSFSRHKKVLHGPDKRQFKTKKK